MYNNVRLSFLLFPHPPPVAQSQLALSSQTLEDGNDVFSSFVSFVDDDDPSVFDGAKERRVGVLHDTPFERCCEHELVDRGVSV